MRREQSFAGGRRDGGVGHNRQSHGRGRPTADVRHRKRVFDCQEGGRQRQRRRRGQKAPRYKHIIIRTGSGPVLLKIYKSLENLIKILYSIHISYYNM